MMRKWTCVTGVILTMALWGPAQTADCHHISNTVSYYDNLRVIVGNITEIHDSDITVVSKGKDQVAIRVYHLTSATRYELRTETTIHRLTSDFIRANDGSLWAVTYCYYCREVYGISKLEGF